mgnify:CR=1 FL=1
MSLIDRVAAGLDTLGKKTQQVFDESKLRMDLARVRRRKDNAARDLGYLAYRTSKGEILPEGESDVLIRRIPAPPPAPGRTDPPPVPPPQSARRRSISIWMPSWTACPVWMARPPN